MSKKRSLNVLMRVAATIMAISITYLMFAFTEMNLDAAVWSKPVRIGAVLFAVCMTAIAHLMPIYPTQKEGDE